MTTQSFCSRKCQSFQYIKALPAVKTTSGYLLGEWRTFSLFMSFVLVMMGSFYPERAFRESWCGYNFQNVTEIWFCRFAVLTSQQRCSSGRVLPFHRWRFFMYKLVLFCTSLSCRVSGVLVGKFNPKDEQTWRMTSGSCWIDIRWFQVRRVFVCLC